MRRREPAGSDAGELTTLSCRTLASAGPARRVAALASAATLAGVLLHAGAAAAQTNITSSGLGTTVTPNGTIFNITGGTPSNGNLFHSFGKFSVGGGHVANFNNIEARPITNILGRVTDGQVSSISGTIQTSNFGTANLFLINPAGWIFGSTASLNVSGSFHVSTADYVRLGDAKFDAIACEMARLLPDAHLVRFPAAHHNPILDAPEAAKERFSTWLAA